MSETEIEVGADVLATELASNGSPVAQIGNAISGVVDASSCEMYGPVGYCAIPSKARPGESACQTVAIKGGQRDALIGYRDTRANPIYGNLTEGDVCIYAGGPEGEGQAKVVLKGDGAVTLATTDNNAADGFGVYLRIDPQKLEFRAPWGRLTFDATGFHVTTTAGGKFDLGGLGTVGAALGMTNYCRVTAQSFTADSPTVWLGPSAISGGGVYMGAAYGAIPPVAPGIPILGAGVGAVVVAASTSTKVFVAV